MSDEEVDLGSDTRAAGLVREFLLLPPEDQELVGALVARLRGIAPADDDVYPPDVPFMNFDT